MTTEVNKLPYKEILEALSNGTDGSNKAISLLQSVMSKAQITPEQSTILDLLSTLEAGEQDLDESVITDETGGDEDDYEEPSDDPKKIYSQLKEELIDLREVNDTTAAALGACRLCWGGDTNCDQCKGRGSAGYYRPDPSLFNELVVPAVNRVRSLKRTSR